MPIPSSPITQIILNQSSLGLTFESGNPKDVGYTLNPQETDPALKKLMEEVFDAARRLAIHIDNQKAPS